MELMFFDLSAAERFGVNEAILLYQLRDLLTEIAEICEGKGVNYRDGNLWLKMSVRCLWHYVPFWSEQQVLRVLKSLKKKGLIKVAKYKDKKAPWDRSNWYALTDLGKEFCYLSDKELYL